MESTTWPAELTRAGERLGRLLDEGADEADASSWLDDLEAALRDLSTALAGFESAVDEGYFEEVVRDAPRLVPAIKRLCESQDELRTTVEEQLLKLHDERSPEAVVDLRQTVSDVVVRLDLCHHRRAGLLFDAYDVDLGGPGA